MYNPQSKQWRPPQQSSCSARRRLFACICCHLVDTGVIAALAVMEWLYNRGHYKVPLHITMSFVYSAHFDYCGNQPALSEMTTRCRERLSLLCWSSILMLSFTCPFVSKVNLRTPFLSDLFHSNILSSKELSRSSILCTAALTREVFAGVHAAVQM